MIFCGARSANPLYLFNRHLQTYNLAVLMAGIAVLGVGVWIAVDTSSFMVALDRIDLWGSTAAAVKSQFSKGVRHVLDAAIVLITAGSLGVVLGIIGCLGVFSESKPLLVIYSTLLLIVVITEIGAGAAFVKSKPQILATVENVFDSNLPNYDFVQTSRKNNRIRPTQLEIINNDTVISTLIVNVLQAWIGCCGETTGYSDFNQSVYWAKEETAPVFCCKFSNWHDLKLKDDTCYDVRTSSNSWMDVGCVNKTQQLINNKLPVVIATSVVAGLIDIFAVIFALGLAYSLGKPGYLEL